MRVFSLKLCIFKLTFSDNFLTAQNLER